MVLNCLYYKKKYKNYDYYVAFVTDEESSFILYDDDHIYEFALGMAIYVNNYLLIYHSKL